MNRLFLLIKIFLILLGMSSATLAQGQNPPGTQTPTPPVNSPGTGGENGGTNVSPGQVLDLSDRIQQLRDAGVPDGEILRQIQIQQGIPGLTAPIDPNASQGDGTTDPPSNQTASDSDQTMEGEDDVLDGEDAEAEDKPEDINKEFLPPPDFSNIYGHHIFRDTTIDFGLRLSPTPEDDYIIGPGDMFTVSAWGTSELTENLLVREDGSVYRPYMGKLYVGGLTYAKAIEILERKYRGIVSSTANLEIFMGKSRRSISVNIVGEVFRPGAYTINAAVPAFNALFESGGVTNIGTVRNIQVKRNGATIQVIDIYDYLINGNDKPVYLQDNDFIYVPVQGKIAEVEGAVLKPKKYELKEDENLKTLISFSGGLKFDAMRSDAQVSRIENSREVLINFPLDSILENSSKDFRIQNGDKLTIKTLNKGAFNVVQVFGNLEYPGTYQLRPGERVSDLINHAGGLLMDAYLDRAYIVRIVPVTGEVLYIPVDLNNIFGNTSSENNLELQYFDLLMVFSKSQFRDERFINVQGQVRNPGTFQTYPGMTLKDLLYLSGGLKEDADFNNIELSVITKPEDVDGDLLIEEGMETETEGAETEPVVNEIEVAPAPGDQLIRRIAIDKDWQNDPVIDTVKIHGFSSLMIYSKYDFIFKKFIDVEGSVNKPGKYQIIKGMTVKDLLYQAGGLTEDADVNEVELYVDIDQEEMGYYGTATDKKEIIRIKIDKDWQLGSIVDSIEVAGYKKMVIRSESDFFSQGFVEVKGLVNNPGVFPVSPNMTLLDLLYMAEGPRMEADFENIELSRIIETMDGSGEIIPVPWLIKKIAINQNWQDDPALSKVKVNSFDQVFIRKNPYFELQESVFISGEVINEGEYHKARKSEPLSSLVGRAGGITELADLKGSYLAREGIGNVALKLHKALRRPGSKYDIHLLEGDTLVIPPRLDIVTITGNVLKPGTTVLYEPGKKRLKYYVNLAGGYDRRTAKRMNTVSYVDGRVKRTKKFFVFKSYPKIEQGSVIEVAQKPEKAGKQPFRPWEKIPIQEIIATTSSVLTFILLIDTIRSR